MIDTEALEWIEHDGKGMPRELAADDIVQVKFRDGVAGLEPLHAGFYSAFNPLANNWFWSGCLPSTDITYYRKVKP